MSTTVGALVQLQRPVIPPVEMYLHLPPWGAYSTPHQAVPPMQPIAVDPAMLAATQRKKDATIMACITYVESSVDSFLGTELGYDHKAVPFDYLDCAPASMAAVEANLDIVIHCLTDLFLPSSSVSQRLLKPVRETAYLRYLDPLLHELQAMAAHVPSIRQDMDHLLQMKTREATVLFEDPSTKKSRGPDDVVPVTGQVASRLQRLENELRTVISHWSRTK